MNIQDNILLDNSIWSALTTRQAGFALGVGSARRFPAEIGPLSGVESVTPKAYAALREATATDGVVVVFLEQEPEPREGWKTVRTGQLDQMVWSGEELPRIDEVREGELRRLGANDAAAMVDLARMTEPGPFELRTHELGSYFGIVDGERLLAMAGERMRIPGMVEVSAVCTHPEARGRGYARRLMLEVMHRIVAGGERPFLHVLSANEGAIRVYEALGYRRRRSMHFEVLQRL
ncbi:MAG TPA: GNAT family N-acetyltransferase [Acidobacteriaceae bacterium]|nr:GNAT family N-acetyltransferase [Acidobacteriaceae bacterium]